MTEGKRKSEFAPFEFVVYGTSSIAEYLRHRPKMVRSIFATAAAAEKAIRELNIRREQIQIAKEPPKDEAARQSPVWAHISMTLTSEIEYLQTLRSPPLVVAVDHVSDPRNLGAIIRSCAFFGIDSVLIPLRRQALLSPAVAASAQGGLACVRIVGVVNLARTLRAMRDEGYWLVGTAADGEKLQTVAGFYEKTVLILGSEDKGVSQNIRATCDRMVGISGAGTLDSLNVSVAAGICIHAFASAARMPAVP